MAEILVKAIDHVHSDPEKDRSGAYKRGMPVLVMPDGHPWGKEEGPPKFTIVKIPGLDPQTIRNKMESWKRTVDYSVVNRSVAQDGWRLRAFAENVSVSDHGVGGGKISRDHIESFINNWNAVVNSVDDNGVIFMVFQLLRNFGD
jgi:hypothetical protein